jgi:hypothetical protein
MRDDPDAGGFDAQEFLHLAGGEVRDSDDQVAAARGQTGLFGKTRAEFRGRVLTGDDEQIVKRGDRPPGGRVHTLVQGMKQIGVGRTAKELTDGIPR